jgi:predicted deacetylase
VKLVVSLHDVAPPYEREIRRQLALLRGEGVGPVVLKVVPNWHGKHPLAAAPSLVDLLHEEARRGSQLVLHGLEHRSHGRLRGTATIRMRGEIFARGAAEFLSFTRGQAAEAVRAGLSSFEASGLPRPSTFCAPGWLMSSEADLGVADAGIERTISMFTLRDHRVRLITVAGIGYMGAGTWQELGVSLLNRLIATTWVPSSAVTRVFLHPQLRSNRAIDGHIRRAGALLRRGWEPAIFDEI